MPARDSNTTPHLPSASISSPLSKSDIETGRPGPSSPSHGYSYGSPTFSLVLPRTSTLPVQNSKQDSFPRTITAPIPETSGSRRKSLRNGYGSTFSPPSADLSSPTSPQHDQPGFMSTFMRRVSAGKSPPDHDGGRSMTRKRSQDMDDKYAHLSASASAIRESSNRLASLSFKPRTSISSALSFTSSDPPSSASPYSVKLSSQASVPAGHSLHHAAGPSHLSQSLAPISGPSSGKDTPERDLSPMAGLLMDGAVSPQAGSSGLSGLSLMMELEKARSVRGTPVLEAKELENESTPKPSRPMSTESLPGVSEASNSSSGAVDDATGPGPTDKVDDGPRDEENGAPAILIEPTREDEEHASKVLHQYLAIPEVDEQEEESETSPLLGGGSSSRPKWRMTQRLTDLKGQTSQKWKKLTWRDVAWACIANPIKTLPSVILGMLLNILDGVSYGMILFPATPVFKGFGSLGVSMFFMSCIVSQLVFSLGGSIFPAGNGSMMIEAVPFFHILVNIIQQEVGDDNRAVIATTMVAFAFSSILTGIVFFALGAFRLGALVGYFPRHILVGCIGGVGVFLLETGLEVSRGLKEEGFQYNLPTLKLFFESPHAVLLWTIPLLLAIVLRIITHFFHHQLIFPAYFFLIPVVFYIVVFAARLEMQSLRDTGWVMDVGSEAQAWWKFYTYFDFERTDWGAFWAGMPTQLALVFFGILHVPLNVPALGVTLCEDNVKLDRELLAHGASNLAAGLTVTVPNYLTYVNSVLFYRVGGGSRLSGIMLALGTGAIMFVGPRVIGYLPVAVVGALIFVLGIDLLMEAVWDTRHKVNRMEYITIWAIAIGMTVWDFVIGLLFGIILACVFFVVQNSRRRALRAVFSGSIAKSTVRRPRPQRAFLQQVGSQTYVMKLQGFLFFGTISAVEDEIRKLLDLAKWQHNPIRFLILDFTLVAALDFSSAEAFARVQRLLSAKNVRLILCGAAPNGLVGSALQGVGLWADREGMEVEVFESLNDALEWSENAYLTAFYENQLALEQEREETRSQIIDFPKVPRPPFSLSQSLQNSPRRSHLAKAGGETLPKTHIPLPPEDPPPAPQPLPLLEQTLGSYAPSTFSSAAYRALVPYFHRVALSPGQTLWKQNESPDGLYLIEHGALRATYLYADHGRHVIETMVAGTIAGDLSTLSDTPRNTTAVAERECVLWMLSRDELGRMEREDPGLAMKLVQVVLKAVAEEQDVLASCILLQSTL